MLRASKFQGDEPKMLEAAAALWGDLASIIIPHVIAVSGTSDVAHRRREVHLLNTKDKWLRTNV